MRNYTALIILLQFSFAGMAQENPSPYTIYNNKGEDISFYAMAAQLSASDVVLFGESHNNSVIHWLQLELTAQLHELKNGHLILGAEMFEADDQIVIEEYFNGMIDAKNFEKEVKLWNNYHTDYKPLLDFAFDHKLKFVATNVPRRYAHMVAHKGVDILKTTQSAAKEFMVPLPFEADSTIPGYAPLYAMSHGSAMNGENFMYAQALKDATMAYFILANAKKDFLFIHYNGDYHSKNRGGIYHYLMTSNKKLKVMTIAVIESEDESYKEEYSELADFIIVTPDNITRTY